MTRLALSMLTLALAGEPSAPPPASAPPTAAQAAASPAILPGFELTPDQRRQAAAVMRRLQPALRDALAAEARARSALFKTVHAAAFDENAIRAASRELARLEEDLAVLRGRLTRDLRALLTPAQQAQLDRLRDDMLAALERKQDQAGRLLDAWIEDYGKDP